MEIIYMEIIKIRKEITLLLQNIVSVKLDKIRTIELGYQSMYLVPPVIIMISYSQQPRNQAII